MEKLVKLAIVCIAIALLVLAIDYVIFHYVTDDGFPSEKQEEAGKPLVTQLVGQFWRAVFVAWHGKPSCGVCAPAKERQPAHKNHQNATPWWQKQQKQRENLGQNTPCWFSLFLQKFVVFFNYIWQNAIYVFDGILCNVVVFPLLVAYTTRNKRLLLVAQATMQKPLFFPISFAQIAVLVCKFSTFFCLQFARSFS